VVKVNRKARRAALRSALSIHAERGTIHVVDAASFDAPSTARAAELLDDFRGGSVLVALADDELTAAKSFRNLTRVGVLHVDDVGVADLIGAATLVISQAALDNLTARARKEAKA
jgi:large subunit ribosomal protein L4